jgi:hypothetical protein
MKRRKIFWLKATESSSYWLKRLNAQLAPRLSEEKPYEGGAHICILAASPGEDGTPHGGGIWRYEKRGLICSVIG